MYPVKVIIGLISTAFFLYFAARGVDLWELFQVILRTDYALLSLAVGLGLVTYWIRALRWKLILLPVKSVGSYSLFTVTVIGFMANNILPLRMGEVVKAFVLRVRENVGVSSALATIVIERAFDGTAIAVISLGILFFPTVPVWIRQAALGLLVFFLCVLTGLTILALYKERLLPWLSLRQGTRGRLGQKVNEIAASFAQGVTILQDTSSVTLIGMFSVGLWLAHAAVFYLILLSLDMDLPLHSTLVILVCTSIGVLLPSAPGYIGTFHYFSVLALAAFGVPKDLALGWALVAHAIQWAPVTLLGLLYTWALGLRIRSFGVQPVHSGEIR